ncbi:MAG: tetratricopeptide repeat protein [Holophagaceae bacterium]|nr:tetratricopeptide repeat protein [Holophagaceae bacterium]
MSSPYKPLKCTSCKMLLLPDSNYCEYCGTKVIRPVLPREYGARKVILPWIVAGFFVVSTAVLFVMLLRYDALERTAKADTLHLQAKKEEEAKIHFDRGKGHIDRGDYDKGIAEYNRYISLIQNDALAYFNRGLALDYSGLHDSAILDYNEVLRLDPNNARAYNNRGVAYSSKGDFGMAIDDYNEALKLDPDYTLAKNNLEKATAAKARAR